MAILVFGHKHPDTDSVVAAIAEAVMLNDCKGAGTAEPRIQGEINPETKFVLERFGLEVPEMLGDVVGQDVALVDTTTVDELPSEIAQANVKFIFDHHRLGGLVTAQPFEGWFRPYGCTCTVLWKVAQKYDDKIPANVAGAMICAILSDTVLFKSPTTTDDDREAVAGLAKLAGVEDYEALGMEMLRAKSLIEDDTAEELVKRDFKDAVYSGKKVGTGQIELVDLAMFDSKKAGVLAEMKRVKAEGGYWGVLMLVTDIMKEGSLVLVESEDNTRVGELLGGDLNSGEGWIDGLMSRKKQVIPPLMEKL